MDKLREAARQALEAIEWGSIDADADRALRKQAITALREALEQPVSQEPEKQPFNCWSTNDGDSWYEHPADAQLLYDVLGDAPKIGDEFEVSAGWHCVTARYRIVSQDGDDFEVECISHPQDNAAPLAQQDTHATHVVRTKDLTDENAIRASEREAIKMDILFALEKDTGAWSPDKAYNDGFNYALDLVEQEIDKRNQMVFNTPVRTKDLTDDEIMKINVDTAGIVPTCDRQFHFARAVIAADREKNK